MSGVILGAAPAIAQPDPFGLRADPALPHLEAALDSSAIATRLAADDDARRALAGWTLESAAVERVQHRAGKLCTVLHRLRMRDAAGVLADEWVVVRTLAHERVAASLERLTAALGGSRPLAAGPLAGVQSIRAWNDLDAVVRVFPHDPGLPTLGRATDPDLAHSWLTAGDEGRAPHAPVRIERIKYMPEKRCVLRHALPRDGRNGSATHPRSIIVKVYPDGRSLDLFGQQRSAWTQLRLQRDAPTLPEPLFHLAEGNSVCYEDWGGRPLADDLDAATLGDAVVRAAGTLAALHRASIRGLPAPPTADALREAAIEDGDKYLARVPSHRDLVAETLEVLARHRPAEPMLAVPIHGAARLEQILVRGDELALIDCDALACGDPMLDVAEFVASLRFLCHERGLDFAAAAERFLTAYADVVPWSVARGRMAWYGLTFTLSKLYGAVKHLDTPTLAALERDASETVRFWIRSLVTPRRRHRRPPPIASNLPRLAEALDPATARLALEDLLRREHPERDLRIEECRVNGVRFKPGKQCALTYRVRGHDAGGAVFDHWLSGRMVVDWERETARLDRENSSEARGSTWKPVLRWPELRMVLRSFPFDPEMPWLERIVDPEVVARMLAEHGAADGLGAAHRRAVACTRVKYRPGKHCVMRYEATGGNGARPVYCKSYASDRGAYVHAALTHLWRHAAASDGELVVARPLGFDPATRSLLTAACEGQNASARAAEVGWEAALSPALMTRLAAAIAMLHGIDWEGPPLLDAPTVGDVLAEARADTREIPRFLPALAATAERLEQRLAASAPSQSERRIPVHGTFKLAQVLCDGDRVALVDFDGLGAGDPHADLGEMLASLYYLRISDGLARDTIEERVERFLAAYRARAAHPPDDARWRWYAAAFLAGKISTSLKTLELTAEDELAPALELVDEVLDGPERRRA